MRWLILSLMLLAVGPACNPADVRETVEIYYENHSDMEKEWRAREMARVMPFYVMGTILALLLMGVAILNALEHARALDKQNENQEEQGGGEAIRFGAWLLLLCFISLFAAMSVRRHWLPAGHPVIAFGVTALFGTLATALAAWQGEKRAVLWVGYVAASLSLPMLGVLLNGEVYLMDTSASLFIGFASGLLVTVVFSNSVRGGLVKFLRKRDQRR